MLQRIELEHFKCFEKLKLPLAPLTLLTGLNASGKSTVIQALALLHQTLVENSGSPGLILNGSDIALGSADEVVDKLTGRETFRIGLEHDDSIMTWTLLVEPDNLIAPLSAFEYQIGRNAEKRVVDQHSRFNQLIPHQKGQSAELVRFEPVLQTLRSLTYISADRIGPRETYPASSSTQQDGVGARGEYTPWFIHQHEALEIPASISLRGSPPLLKRQVEAWLARFFPGSGIDVQPIPRTNLLTMRLRASLATDYHRPANVGYGLSHLLPVITACLGAVGFAQRDEQLAPLVMVENPELHLHPAGQAAIGVFLARAAASGAQVIIETHSDHVLNGIRRAIKGIDGASILTPEQVAIYFFQPRDFAPNRSQVISPLIDKNGNLDSWPAGFFDQFDKDTAALIGW